MQVVENTCIGHGISLRKISEPLALKALDFRPVTAQPQEMQCCRSATSLMWRLQHVAFRNLSAPCLRAGFQTTCPRNPDTVSSRYPKLPELILSLRQNPRKHTNTRGYFQDTYLPVIFL